MTRQEKLMNQALSEMKLAKVNVDKWCEMLRDGSYPYTTTHIYKALKAMQLAASVPPPTVPTPPVPPQPAINLAPVRRLLVLTNDISEALACKKYLLIATADLAYRDNYTSDFIHQAIAEDRFRVWCDCRASPDGTPPQVALDWLKALGLPQYYFYGQCESSTECTTGFIAGARKFIGNVTALNDSQLTLVKTGEILMTNETYYNVTPNLVPDWKNANAGIGGNCQAVYASSTEGASYFSLQDQHSRGLFNTDHDSVYVAGFQAGDWAFLKAV